MKGIADLLDSDMEDSVPLIDENSILSSASDATNASSTKPAPAKRAKKRQRVTMPPKFKSKTQKSAPSQTKKGLPKQIAGVKRKAAESHEDGTNDVKENNAEAEDEAPAAKPKKRGRPATKAKAAIQAVDVEETEDDLVEAVPLPVEARSKHAASKTTKPTVKAASKAAAPAKSNPQQFRTIVAEQELEEADETKEELAPASPPRSRVVARAASRTRQDPPFRRRAGSASDTERGDPNLRRKLGDITRKFENVELKYRNLKEVGINEANANMERLRKQCDSTTQASNELIASLKKELATQAPVAQEARKLKRQMQTQEDEMSKMRETAADLTKSLAAAQNEIKALHAKLAAARSSAADNPKTPASSIKNTQRSVATSNIEAQMKLDLYSDLTGLVVLNVKQTEEGDSYQCIQTGQNGSKSNLMTCRDRLTDDYSVAFPTLYRPRNCEDHELRRDGIFVSTAVGRRSRP
jgi:hypothetical protein